MVGIPATVERFVIPFAVCSAILNNGDATTNDALKPSLTLLSKLGSIAIHAEEMLSPTGLYVDRISLEGLLQDAEVVSWLKEMKVYLPVKR